jgi:hypothetical protein
MARLHWRTKTWLEWNASTRLTRSAGLRSRCCRVAMPCQRAHDSLTCSVHAPLHVPDETSLQAMPLTITRHSANSVRQAIVPSTRKTTHTAWAPSTLGYWQPSSADPSTNKICPWRKWPDGTAVGGKLETIAGQACQVQWAHEPYTAAAAAAAA